MEYLIPWLQPSGYPALRLHALIPFGGFSLPSIYCGSILGFRPFGFLAGPHWFHFA
jgi:hypothetical protein